MSAVGERLLIATGGVLLGAAAANLLVLDPAQTVTSDLPRLYRDAGWAAASWVLVAVGWAAGCWLLLRRAVRVRTAAGPALAVALLGLLLCTGVVPGFLLGLGQYTVAEDGGYAPRAASLGTVSGALLLLGQLLVLGGSLAALARARRARRDVRG